MYNIYNLVIVSVRMSCSLITEGGGNGKNGSSCFCSLFAICSYNW